MFTSCPYLFRAIIRSGLDAGRITNLGNNDGEFDISTFKSNCCGPLCSRYTDKRPLSPIAPESGTKSKLFYLE